MWLITVGAVYSTVPDTEAARVVLGAAIPVACLGLPFLYARFGTGGAAASVCVLGWVIGQDGLGRPGAVVGAVATIGLFALEPLVRSLRDRARGRPSRREIPIVPAVTVHLGCALAAARWAGLAHGADEAALRLAVILPFALLLTAGVEDGARGTLRAR